MGKYRASFRYDMDAGFTGHRTATVTVDATDEHDAARKVEAAMQGLVDRAVTLSEPVSPAPVERGRGTLGWAPGVVDPVSILEQRVLACRGRAREPSRDEFIRALGNVLDAYDLKGITLNGDNGAVAEMHRAHVAEARKLLAAVKPKGGG